MPTLGQLSPCGRLETYRCRLGRVVASRVELFHSGVRDGIKPFIGGGDARHRVSLEIGLPVTDPYRGGNAGRGGTGGSPPSGTVCLHHWKVVTILSRGRRRDHPSHGRVGYRQLRRGTWHGPPASTESAFGWRRTWSTAASKRRDDRPMDHRSGPGTRVHCRPGRTAVGRSRIRAADPGAARARGVRLRPRPRGRRVPRTARNRQDPFGTGLAVRARQAGHRVLFNTAAHSFRGNWLNFQPQLSPARPPCRCDVITNERWLTAAGSSTRIDTPGRDEGGRAAVPVARHARWADQGPQEPRPTWPTADIRTVFAQRLSSILRIIQMSATSTRTQAPVNGRRRGCQGLPPKRPSRSGWDCSPFRVPADRE